MSENPNDPNKPTGNEISDYYNDVKKNEIQTYESGIKKARNALFVTAALVLIGEIIAANMSDIPFTPLFIGIVALETGIFIALALWTKSKPYSAIIIGLILFLLIWVASIAINGARGVYSGIIVKALIIYFLVSALKPAKAWEDAKKTM